jgi:hypothetical protein
MAANLGKRKRQRNAPAECDADDTRDDEATRALFQRAFEKRFKALATKPLNTATKSAKVELEDESDSQGSDWEGLSDESEDAVQIVDYTRSDEKTDDSAVVDRSLEKLFMVSCAAQALPQAVLMFHSLRSPPDRKTRQQKRWPRRQRLRMTEQRA